MCSPGPPAPCTSDSVTPARPAAHRNSTLGPAKRDPGAILVVDDELEVRNVLAQTLMDEGYRVVQTGDGRSALEHMERCLPGLVVLDLLMPTMGGLEVLDGMHRRAGTLSEVPVIVLSESHARLPRGVGNVVAQMRKPVNLDLLVQRAGAVLNHPGGRGTWSSFTTSE